MREPYIRQVKRALSIPRRAKKEVIRDLDEIFASALENGETRQQVLERLGSPEEFAENTAQQLGIDLAAARRRRRMVLAVAALLLAAAAFGLWCAIRFGGTAPEIIGQADAMTQIQIAGGFAFDLSRVFLGIGVAALVLAGIQIVRILQKRR